MNPTMDNLQRLENTSIHILREAYAAFSTLANSSPAGEDFTT